MPITHINSDLARQQTTTTGTGTLSMGGVPAGCRSIVAAVGSGKKLASSYRPTAGWIGRFSRE